MTGRLVPRLAAAVFALSCASADALLIEGTVTQSRTHTCNIGFLGLEEHYDYPALCAGVIEVKAPGEQYGKQLTVSLRVPTYDPEGKVHTLPTYGMGVRADYDPVDGLNMARSVQITDLNSSQEPVAQPGPETWPDDKLVKYVEDDYLKDYARHMKLLLDRGNSNVLRKRLASESANERYTGFWAINDLRTPGFEPEAVAAASDPDRAVRHEAIYYLGDQKLYGHADLVAESLSHANASIRREAAWYLGEAKAVKYKERLAKLLKTEKDEAARKAESDALEKLK
ncbi:MAG: HEAT repeat domain-containing protein [Elusimicrobia bacterium]|nr:HEAT repeat domain-containing protein [Elusimicrobiota bacterium]